MILHHFCWRSLNNTLFWPNTLIFNPRSKKYIKHPKKYQKILGFLGTPVETPVETPVGTPVGTPGLYQLDFVEDNRHHKVSGTLIQILQRLEKYIRGEQRESIASLHCRSLHNIPVMEWLKCMGGKPIFLYILKYVDDFLSNIKVFNWKNKRFWVSPGKTMHNHLEIS